MSTPVCRLLLDAKGLAKQSRKCSLPLRIILTLKEKTIHIKNTGSSNTLTNLKWDHPNTKAEKRKMLKGLAELLLW